MKGFRTALGILAALAIAVVAFLWLNFYHVHVRYRLTVEVQDGNQIKTGSSVIDVSYSIEPDWTPSGPNAKVRTIGYAPTVDLGEKGLLFLSFANAQRSPDQIRESSKKVFCLVNDIGCLPVAAYDKPGTVIGSVSSPERRAALREVLSQSGPRDVPFAVLPRLLRSLNVDHPNPLVTVSPDDLSGSFGPGVQLKRVTLQLTDDPVTPMPTIWPQWLKENGHIDDAILKGYQNG